MTFKKNQAMATPTEKQALRAKLEQYEGEIAHMYLDSKGFVTVGVGHLISSATEAHKLAFKTTKNTSATSTEISADYNAIKKQPPNRIAAFYKSHTKLTRQR